MSGSNSKTVSVTGTYPSTTTLSYGGMTGNYSLTATVSGNGAAAPTGTISFQDTSNNSLSLGTATLEAVQSPLSFEAASSLAAGASSFGSLTADVNGDGFLDSVALILPTSHSVPYSVSVALGNGDGTFQMPLSFDLSLSPAAIAISDLNMDGKSDLVVAGTALGGTVQVYLGNGDGTFTIGGTLPVSGPLDNVNVGAIAVADFNGDGKPDLVVTYGSENQTNPTPSGSVVVYLGKDDGTFQPPSAPSLVGNLATVPGSMAVGDFNQDGKLPIRTRPSRPRSLP